MKIVLLRYCHYCGKHTSEWPKPERAWKSPYCDPEHRRLAANEKKEIRRNAQNQVLARRAARMAAKANADATAAC